LACLGVEKSERARASIAVLIQKDLVKYIQDMQYINERCLRLDPRIYDTDVTFLAVYAPTDSSIAQMKDVFHEMLNQQLDQIKY